jgi:hypothetical protein
MGVNFLLAYYGSRKMFERLHSSLEQWAKRKNQDNYSAILKTLRIVLRKFLGKN